MAPGTQACLGVFGTTRVGTRTQGTTEALQSRDVVCDRYGPVRIHVRIDLRTLVLVAQLPELFVDGGSGAQSVCNRKHG